MVNTSANSLSKRKKSTADKLKKSSEHTSVLSKVQESLNTKFVQNPQIINYTKKNQSTANLQALNRSVAERNLNQGSTSTTALPRKQHNRVMADQAQLSMINRDTMNYSIA
mmetsp:Transcript_5945/g.7205  ORF Transcript_5945/g.7205 Transcript_5945/m.7205 type:complete len:111 (+) Transcript_5945:86-418(+)|eukprot:CAMPEP_0170458944 /NCGR_PEP_ID=MMETSP0123-20130129/5769_1 /TAXON_ID=182087 /ORGANISM="Favella ehrenbergii, Strain Fehren 1" /LENGTH=110 /DNA_ID=CAMNT_0010723309 /DNA_START=149 /DNA_END=481 /DNA_ORIENTATION=-